MTEYVIYAVELAVVATLMALALSVYLDGIGYTVLHLVALAGVGGYVFAILARTAIPPLVAAATAAVAAGVSGIAVAELVRRLRDDGLTLATFGIGVAAFELFRYLRITDGVFGIGRIPAVFPVGGNVAQIGTAAVALTLALIVTSVWRQSVAGTVAVAIRLDEAAAISIGTPLRSHQRLSGGLAGVLAGIAGVLLAASTHFIEPRDFQPNTNLLPIVAVMIAGGRTPGGVFGVALTITVLTHFARLMDRTATLAGPLTEIAIASTLIVVLVLTNAWRRRRGNARG